MPLRVAFLWHMHQPHYVDSVRGAALMPWVRLHATKGYLDMIWLVEQYPEFHCTFNLTPVLLRQIEQFATNQVRDLWHELAVTPAADLTLDQKCALLEHYFKANWANMIKPHPRYWSLLQKRGTEYDHADLTRIAGAFGEQEYRDLQVWYPLTWFGYAAQQLYPEIGSLKQKGQDFTEQDKQAVLSCQQDVLRSLIGRYKTAMQRGQIEISTSPFYHPILPLLCDTEFARRCMPGCRLPTRYTQPEDARSQIELARQEYVHHFGTEPRGLWPSEGSVCPELVPMLRDTGYEWIATDEEILWRSLATEHPSASFDRSRLFEGYRIEHGGKQICGAFRDRSLSDFIGFTAARNPPRQAADLLVSQLEHLARSRKTDAFCPIILDGENAWEHFHDGGEAFLRTLYQRLSAHPEIATTTYHDYFVTHPPKAIVRTLYTGSWINADFHIWISDLEDNRAWQLLGETRTFLEAKLAEGNIPTELRQKAMAEIFAAEGSDWFWWYGDQFVTEDDVLFDELFRTHLQNVYRLFGSPVPLALKANICRAETAYERTPPTELISPIIDGKATSYYEWQGAGLYEAGRDMSAMHWSDRVIQRLFYGTDLSNLYLRVDFLPEVQFKEGMVLRVNIFQPTAHILDIVMKERNACLGVFRNTGQRLPADHVVYDTVLELRVPLDRLDWKSGRSVMFDVQVLSNALERERHPNLGVLTLDVPDETHQVQNWQL